MDEKRLRIGELLIEAGVLDPDRLRAALELQKQQRRPLGQLLVESGFVTEAQLIQALSRQLSIPWVSLWHIDVAPELLAIVAREDAERYGLLPIYARTVRGERPALFVAMDDPTNGEAIEFVRQAAGMEVRPMIAAPTDLRQAIRGLYAPEEEDEEDEAAATPLPPPITTRRSSRPPPPPPPRAVRPPAAGDDEALELTEPAAGEDDAALADAPIPPPEASGEPGAADAEQALAPAYAPGAIEPSAAASADAPAAAEPSFMVPGALEGGAAPAPAPAALAPGALESFAEQHAQRQRRALAFTFLDGTSIALGDAAGPGAGPAMPLDELVAALRRYADDPAAPEPYGARGVSRVVAALIEILERKSLVTAAEMAVALPRRPPER